MKWIRTVKQYHITNQQLQKFRAAAARERYQPLSLLALLSYEALVSQAEDLQEQIDQYTQATHGH